MIKGFHTLHRGLKSSLTPDFTGKQGIDEFNNALPELKKMSKYAKLSFYGDGFLTEDIVVLAKTKNIRKRLIGKLTDNQKDVFGRANKTFYIQNSNTYDYETRKPLTAEWFVELANNAINKFNGTT